MIDLAREQQELVRRILQHQLPTRQVWIFGPRAIGTAEPWSDLEIVILGEPPVDSLALAEARADFEESGLPFRMDMTLWRDLPDNLQQHIAQSGQPLQPLEHRPRSPAESCPSSRWYRHHPIHSSSSTSASAVQLDQSLPGA